MLAVTENARTIVKEITENAAPDITALRITADDSPQPEFAVTAVGAAEPGDATLDEQGATIHLDPAAAEQLEDKVLDASVDQSGGVQFSLLPQA